MVEGRSSHHREPAMNWGVLLAATYARLLACLADDLGELPEPAAKRFDRELLNRICRVHSGQLVFAPRRSATPAPALKTLSFLAGLPTDFVDGLVRSAPPVVAALPKDPQRFAVLGNVLSAFLATRCLPGKRIAVRRLKVSTDPRWSPLDLVTWGLPQLNPVVTNRRDRIAAAAPTLQVAESIAGASRATVARIRRRQRLLTAPLA